jgi:hypothetical protein
VHFRDEQQKRKRHQSRDGGEGEAFPTCQHPCFPLIRTGRGENSVIRFYRNSRFRQGQNLAAGGLNPAASAYANQVGGKSCE